MCDSLSRCCNGDNSNPYNGYHHVGRLLGKLEINISWLPRWIYHDLSLGHSDATGAHVLVVYKHGLLLFDECNQLDILDVIDHHNPAITGAIWFIVHFNFHWIKINLFFEWNWIELMMSQGINTLSIGYDLNRIISFCIALCWIFTRSKYSCVHNRILLNKPDSYLLVPMMLKLPHLSLLYIYFSNDAHCQQYTSAGILLNKNRSRRVNSADNGTRHVALAWHALFWNCRAISFFRDDSHASARRNPWDPI